MFHALRRWTRVSGAAVIAAALALAQEPPEPKYGYEVATVKKSDPATRGSRIGSGPQGGMRTTNTTLVVLLAFAYDIRDYQILDAPGWAKSEAFDVSFTPDKPETPLSQGGMDLKTIETVLDRQRQRLQAVLRDRFGLKLGVETRDLPIYSLAVAKSGSKLKPPDPAAKGPSMGMRGQGDLTGTGANMRMLTNILSTVLREPVIDRTGIEGTFDMKLQWKPDSFTGVPAGPGDAASSDADGPSIFTAITEQLGLKLERAKGPVTVYVVEKAEHPTDN